MMIRTMLLVVIFTIVEVVTINTNPVMKYGYNYFAALIIKGDENNGITMYEGSYIMIKPFTKIGDKTYYGEELRLNILANGRYEFAKKEYQVSENGLDAILGVKKKSISDLM